MPDTSPIFHGKDLTKAFANAKALEKVSLTFPSSGIVAIIGPNGAGKTTLLNVLTGFLYADAGRFYLGDRELTRMSPHQIARLGVARTFQDLRLISQVPVLDNVMLARPNQKGERLLNALMRIGVAKEEKQNRIEAMRWLRFVGLEEKAQELAGELSYGQQKLLALACCLAAEPKILLLDEPVSGVHPEMISQIVELLRQLKEQGRLVVIVEHNIAVVKEIASRVVVMDQGRIIADGAPGDILNQPEILEAYVG